MLNTNLLQPLGIVLHKANLISLPQLELALHDQSHYQEMRLGEILALRGWIKQETADFFAEEWVNILQEHNKHPLGFYLKQAALLNEEQIEYILIDQKQSLLRFGAVAVIKGWVKQNTIEFFIQHLFPEEVKASPVTRKPSSHYRHPRKPTFVLDQDIVNLAKVSEEYLTKDSTNNNSQKRKLFFF